MSELESFNPEQFSIDRLQIKALTKTPETKGKFKKLDWPLELQGKGVTDENDRSLEIRFPKGDLLLSFVTTIHELGHLGQEQLVSALKSDMQNHDSLFAQENDAWQRGWDRIVKTRPDMLAFLETKFKTVDKIDQNDITSFADLYQWIQANALRMVEAQKILFEPDDQVDSGGDAKFDQLYKELRRFGIESFLERYKTFRTGELVDEDQMIEFIKDISRSVIKELNQLVV